MEFKHNKKRNIGLISEFFSRYIATAFIDGRHGDIEKANRIWQKYISPKTETYKEFVLFNALHDTALKNKQIAHSLLERVKSEVQKQSQEKLDREKSALINEINVSLKDSDFFKRSVSNYRTIASVQLLMNAWRGTGFKGGFADLAVLEESILEHMLQDKVLITEEMANVSAEDIDSLVVKIMTEKFNRKYSDTLNPEQKEIVRLFAFSGKDSAARTELVSLLSQIQEKTLKVMSSRTLNESSLDRPLRNKLAEIKALMSDGGEYGDVTKLTEDAISFYMTISKLREEMESE